MLLAGQLVDTRWRHSVQLGVQRRPWRSGIGEYGQGDGGVLSANGVVSHVSKLRTALSRLEHGKSFWSSKALSV